MHTVWTVLALISALGTVPAQTLSDSQVQQVKSNLASVAKQSWEIGTRMQALLSLDTPSFSALNSTVPPSTKPPSSLSDVLSSAKSVLSNAPSGNGPHSLFPDDGSAADPASTGIGLLIANWTGQSGDYAGALESEVDFLLNKAPRSSKGAISHRTSQAQLWSDFIYMVPPFLAYYGVTTGNQSMVQEAHTQVGLYRDALRDGKAHNLWHHIVGGDGGTDAGHWSTGNAWAAAGMLRVLGTIQHGPFAGALKGEAGDLQNWVGEIHDGMFRHVQPSGLFLNYADAQPAQSFEDAAATALLVASVYRLNLLTGQSKHLSQADQMRQTLFASNGTHVDSDGWLTPVVDPENVGQKGSHSPEAQAFVLELHSAYRDWKASGGKTSSAVHSTSVSIVVVLLMTAAGVLFC